MATSAADTVELEKRIVADLICCWERKEEDCYKTLRASEAELNVVQNECVG